MKKNNCIIQDNERFVYELKLADDVINRYGQDYLDDYGCSVSSDLIERYRKFMEEYESIQLELHRINEERLNKS